MDGQTDAKRVSLLEAFIAALNGPIGHIDVFEEDSQKRIYKQLERILDLTVSVVGDIDNGRDVSKATLDGFTNLPDDLGFWEIEHGQGDSLEEINEMTPSLHVGDFEIGDVLSLEELVGALELARLVVAVEPKDVKAFMAGIELLIHDEGGGYRDEEALVKLLALSCVHPQAELFIYQTLIDPDSFDESQAIAVKKIGEAWERHLPEALEALRENARKWHVENEGPADDFIAREAATKNPDTGVHEATMRPHSGTHSKTSFAKVDVAMEARINALCDMFNETAALAMALTGNEMNCAHVQMAMMQSMLGHMIAAHKHTPMEAFESMREQIDNLEEAYDQQLAKMEASSEDEADAVPPTP